MKDLSSSEKIRTHFQKKDVQERVWRRMLDARSKATVTISRAASLFDLTENKLREYEKRGLLSTERTLQSSEGPGPGHRQYSPENLDRLALLKELFDEGYAPGEIPPDFDMIWKEVAGEKYRILAEGRTLSSFIQEPRHYQIDRRVEHADTEAFWRYFVSQILRLSVLAVCEDIPDTLAGIILPLNRDSDVSMVEKPEELVKVGLSLVGWLGLNKSFYVFLDPAPSFEYPSDFRVERVLAPGAHAGEKRSNYPLIIVQRKARTLFLKPELVTTIHRLLELVYAHIEDWRKCYEPEMRDWVYQITDFSAGSSVSDATLNGLMNMIIELGGKNASGEDRWNFCNLFLPENTALPMQQHRLALRAHSERSPVRHGDITMSSVHPGLTFRAYLGGYVMYRPEILPEDPILEYREYEEDTRSAIAIPVLGEESLAVGVLYIAANGQNAFSYADQQALRFLARIVEDLLATYQARQHIDRRLSDLLARPQVVDLAFQQFLSENAFIQDLERILADIVKPDLARTLFPESDEALSIISIDIDNQSLLALQLGDKVARNLSREVGKRIQGQLNLFSDPEYRKLYHAGADRYYLLLNGMDLEEAKSKALSLHKTLVGVYRIDARRIVLGRPLPLEGLFELPHVTVRIGVQSYPYRKLEEILQRYPTESAIVKTRALLMQNISLALERGQSEGGNCIISWNPEIWNYEVWKPAETTQTSRREES